MDAAVLDDIEAVATESPPPKLGEGDDVWIVFFRSNTMPGGQELGAWDAIPARVVVAGKLVVAEVALHLPPTFGNADGRESPYGSPLRFASPADVFLDRADADLACKTRPKPKP